MTKENVIIGGLAGLGSYLMGLPFELLWIYMILMSIDILTGLIKSAKKQEFSSSVMRSGLLKKANDILILFALILLQRVCSLNGIEIPVGSMLVGVVCVKEFFSILENYVEMNGRLPNFIMNWLKVVKKQFGEEKSD